MDPSDPAAWAGRSETPHDLITAAPMLGLNATLDPASMAVDHATALRPLWHGRLFLPTQRRSEIGPEGMPSAAAFCRRHRTMPATWRCRPWPCRRSIAALRCAALPRQA
jgi:hydroxyacyl-ACP dehydratase HTD2-like protein with hotdog domain